MKMKKNLLINFLLIFLTIVAFTYGDSVQLNGGKINLKITGKAEFTLEYKNKKIITRKDPQVWLGFGSIYFYWPSSHVSYIFPGGIKITGYAFGRKKDISSMTVYNKTQIIYYFNVNTDKPVVKKMSTLIRCGKKTINVIKLLDLLQPDGIRIIFNGKKCFREDGLPLKFYRLRYCPKKKRVIEVTLKEHKLEQWR